MELPRPPGRHYTGAGPAALVVALARRHPTDILWDPTCGDGAILRAARELGHPAQRLRGTDLDALALPIARAALPGAHLEHADLFDLKPVGDRLVDTIVGNPPFLRHEGIGPRKGSIHAVLTRSWGPTVPERADLSLLCLLHALCFLHPGGRLAFVLPNTSFDGQAGDVVRRLILRRFRLLALVESRVEPWFAEAAVQTLIVCIEASSPSTRACFSQLRVPADAAVADGVLGTSVRNGVECRSLDPREGRWTAALRSTPAYEEMLALPKVHRIGETGSAFALRYGLKVGATDFFAPRDSQILRDAGIEPTWLQPFIRSLRGIDRRIIRREDADGLLFVGGEGADDAHTHPGAAAWIAGGALRQGSGGVPWPLAPSVQGNRPWWRLRPPAFGPLLLPQFRGDRHHVVWNPARLPSNNSCWTVDLTPGVEEELAAALLDSSPLALAAEVEGRANLGEGLLTLYGPDLHALPVVDPRSVEKVSRTTLIAAWLALAERPARPFPLEVADPLRVALDDAWERAADAPHGLAAALRMDAVRLLGERMQLARLRKSAGQAQVGDRSSIT